MLIPVGEFSKYLERTSKLVFGIRELEYTWNDETNDPDIKSLDYDIEYKHRWSDKYRRILLWRLYNLLYYYEKYPDKRPRYSMMVTITGEHDSPRYRKRVKLGHMDYLEKHYWARKKLLNLIRKHLVDEGRILMSEGHPESGMIHDHIVYFLNEIPSDKVLATIKREWNDNLKMGSAERGVTIEIKSVNDFDDIQSLVAYPMAYAGKNLSNSIDDWTAEDWVFNASIYWSSRPVQKKKILGCDISGLGHNIRIFQPCRKLSKIMSMEYSPDDQKSTQREPDRVFVDTRLFTTYLDKIPVEYASGYKGFEYFRDPDNLPFIVARSKDYDLLFEWQLYNGDLDIKRGDLPTDRPELYDISLQKSIHQLFQNAVQDQFGWYESPWNDKTGYE